MKSLKDFIYECQNINEEIDDNIFWKIDTYFQNNENELKSFNGLVDICRANKGFNDATIDAYITGNDLLLKNKKKFVDFIEDNVQPDSSINKNYTSAFTNIIKTVIGNKTDGTKYTNL